MLLTMDRATATRSAVLALRQQIQARSLDSLEDMAREIAEIDDRIDPVDIAYTVAGEVESLARQCIPHLPHLDPELLVEGATMRDLFALTRGDLRLIGGALGAQLGAVYEVEHCPGCSDWIDAMQLAEVSLGDPGLLAWLGSARKGERRKNIRRIA